MTGTQSLERTCGLCAWTQIDSVNNLLGRWEIRENDPNNPNTCRGWIRITENTPTITIGTKLRLHLTNHDNSERILNVMIMHLNSSEPVWNFVAA